MRRRIIFGSLLAVMVIGLSGTVAWLAGTEDGARWILDRVSRYTEVTVTADRLTGCLASDLSLEGVQVRHADREILIEKGKLSWRVWELALGRITFREVSLQGVSWREKKPDMEPPDLTWPKVPPWLARLWGGIRAFQISKFVYLSPDNDPVTVDRMRARLEWRFGTLTLSEIEGQIPLGRLSGTVGMGLTDPALFGEITVKSGHALAGIDQMTLAMTPAKTAGREQVAGDLRFTAWAGKEVRIKALGRVGIKKEGVIIHDLQVRDPVLCDKASAKGEIVLLRSGIDASLQFHVAGLRPGKDSKERADLSGLVSLKGNLNEYRGRLELHQRMSVASWLSGHFQGDFSGNDQGLSIRDATAAVMGGRISGRVEWKWTDGYRLTWTAQARQMNPGMIQPEWQGRVNLNADGTLAWLKSEPLQGRFKVVLTDSLLHGKSLSGSMEARWEKGMLRLDQCAFRGRGFQVTARGALEERIVYQVRVTDLSGLFPETAGQVQASGWVRREKGEWAGILTGRSVSMSVSGLALESVDVSARLNDPERGRIDATLTCGKSAIGPFSVTRGKVEVTGKVSDHTIQVSLTGVQGEARVSMAGRYMQQKWEASVMDGWLHEHRTGTLRLVRPAVIYLSREQMGIRGMALAGPAEEGLWVDGDVSFKSKKGSLAVRWKKLNLARANVLLDGEKLAGETTGSLSLGWIENRLVNLAASGTGTFSWTQDSQTFTIEGASYQASGGGGGIAGTWTVAMKESGRMEGSFSASAPTGFVFPESGQFHANWRAIDVALLMPWLGKTVQPAGRINGEIRAAFRGKTLAEMEGRTDISAGQLTWKTEQGVIAASIRQAVVIFKGNSKKLSGDLSMEAADYGQVTGTFALPVVSYLPFRLDDAGQIRLQAKGKLQEKGLLSAVFPGIVKETRGQVQFDIGATGTWRQPDFQGESLFGRGRGLLPRGGASSGGGERGHPMDSRPNQN